ncbi:MAG: type II secretion system protein [Cyanobacteria bacterium SIG26]|nr:type II secretion system protein [Cyanobacteria bacterium SIG26]
MVKFNNSKHLGEGVASKHSPRLGFTLAEVLITLGIIGVVAAMTIPTLITNTNSAKFRAQFKKTLSTLNQAVRSNVANYGWDFSLMSGTSNLLSHNPEEIRTFESMMYGSLAGATIEEFASETMKEYEKNGRDSFISYTDGDWGSAFVAKLSDGSTLTMPLGPAEGFCTLTLGESISAKLSSDERFLNCCLVYIDVNGINGPNKEVQCSDGVQTKPEPDKPCVVKNNDITDIFPVIVYDSTVEPMTNAAKYVLSSSK